MAMTLVAVERRFTRSSEPFGSAIPVSLFGFSLRVATGPSGLVETFGYKGQELFRGAEAPFPSGVDLLDGTLEMALCRLRPWAQLEHERVSHQMSRYDAPHVRDVKKPFNFP
jgi:hypothetical protein